MHNRYRQLQGFTIVELLIVIVVIGILAAITLVSFNGIQQRASEVVLKNDLSNAAKQLEIARINDGSYPDSDTFLGKSEGTSYQYDVDGGNYCLTATSSRLSGFSFHVSSVNSTIQQGACSGHVSDANELWAAGWRVVQSSDYDDPGLARGNGIISLSSLRAQTGSQSLRIDYDATVKYGLVQKAFTGLTPGDDYTVTAQVYLPSGQDDDIASGLLFIGQGPAPGAYAGNIWVEYFGGNADEYRDGINVARWDQWSSIEVPFTADAATVYVSIGLETYSQPLGGPVHIYYDNVILTPAS